VAFAIGEMIQAPRYYEYISEIAPAGQQGLFQGYAFLPIAIARFAGPARRMGVPDRQSRRYAGMIWIALIATGVLQRC